MQVVCMAGSELWQLMSTRMFVLGWARHQCRKRRAMRLRQKLFCIGLMPLLLQQHNQRLRAMKLLALGYGALLPCPVSAQHAAV
jgi:hypothetical protein